MRAKPLENKCHLIQPFKVVLVFLKVGCFGCWKLRRCWRLHSSNQDLRSEDLLTYFLSWAKSMCFIRVNEIDNNASILGTWWHKNGTKQRIPTLFAAISRWFLLITFFCSLFPSHFHVFLIRMTKINLIRTDTIYGTIWYALIGISISLRRSHIYMILISGYMICMEWTRGTGKSARAQGIGTGTVKNGAVIRIRRFCNGANTGRLASRLKFVSYFCKNCQFCENPWRYRLKLSVTEWTIMYSALVHKQHVEYLSVKFMRTCPDEQLMSRRQFVHEKQPYYFAVIQQCSFTCWCIRQRYTMGQLDEVVAE